MFKSYKEIKKANQGNTFKPGALSVSGDCKSRKMVSDASNSSNSKLTTISELQEKFKTELFFIKWENQKSCICIFTNRIAC